jgi:Ran GTPase-activating protein (RanGAP) involved in mRNA processing and transport
MFPFHTPLLLMSVRAGNTMEYANGLKIFVEVAIFATLISLNRFYFGIKKTFNHLLKIEKNLHDIRFRINRVKPSKSTKNIHKRDIKAIAIY